jgi:hypothetical protein
MILFVTISVFIIPRIFALFTLFFFNGDLLGLLVVVLVVVNYWWSHSDYVILYVS